MFFKVLRKLTHYSITLYNIKIIYIFSAAPHYPTPQLGFCISMYCSSVTAGNKVLAHFVIWHVAIENRIGGERKNLLVMIYLWVVDLFTLLYGQLWWSPLPQNKWKLGRMEFCIHSVCLHIFFVLKFLSRCSWWYL